MDTVAPPGFSWVIPGLLSAHAWPSLPAHYKFLVDEGVKYIVSLTEGLPPEVKSCPALVSVHYPIVDFHPPSTEQIMKFVTLMDRAKANHEAATVHCRVGHGRTGTIIACYFIYAEGLTAEQAIVKIRQLRPGSIETRGQEQAIAEFEAYLSSQAKK